MRNSFFITAILFFSSTAHAEEDQTNYPKEEMQKCMETSVARADESMTIKSLKDACTLLLQQGENTAADNSLSTPNELKKANATPNNQTTTQGSLKKDKQSPEEKSTSSINTKIPTNKSNQEIPQHLLRDRLAMEALNRSNRFILTPHKRNYLLPVVYSDNPNSEPYSNSDTTLKDLNHTEAELQLSVKILIRENIFDNNGHLYLGYTNHALWQVYNRRLSAPFRETDHQPELILSFTNDWEIFGFRNAVNEAIINHQSNGQTGLLSRSWNRIMLTSVFEKGNFVLSFNPWYRLPEEEQEYPGDPRGDDNPDISKYMGHFELAGAYKYNSDIFSVQIRNNLHSENYGAIELGWTFPVTKTMRGFINYFDGYGHSLIDYNTHQRTVGLGIIFTDLF